ncbi:MAG: FAD:protein FMN transferase [Aureliella sp.]
MSDAAPERSDPATQQGPLVEGAAGDSFEPIPKPLAEWLDELRISGDAAPSEPSEPVNAQANIAADVPLLSASRAAMACEFEVLLNRGQHPGSVDRAVEALDEVQRLEGLLSIYRQQSDLSTVNRFAHRNPVPVQPDTMRMLQIGEAIGKLTGGAFDLTAGKLSSLWGFSRRAGKMPDADEIQKSLECVGLQMVDLLPTEGQVRMQREGIELNPGGIGKGYALDRAAEHLRNHGVGDFMIHGGQSSIVAFGDRQHSAVCGGWKVAVRHPLRPEITVGTLRLRDQALGTSGSGKQFFHFRGRRYSHIIDPRTGYPADGLLSATVVVPSGTVADALATALFVMGPEAALEFCRKTPWLGAILLKNQIGSQKLQIEVVNLTAEAWEQAI